MKNSLKRILSILLAVTIILGSAVVGLSEVDFGGFFVAAAKTAYAVGDIVKFGCYKQNAIKNTNGETIGFDLAPIKWRIIKIENGKALLLSNEIIDTKQYNSTSATVDGYYANNYAHSDIREWLINDFYDTAFSATEKNMILSTTLDNSACSTSVNASGSYTKYTSESTTDKVFLLSKSEADSYASNYFKTTVTDYAYANGFVPGSGTEPSNHWLLRTAGNNTYQIYTVHVRWGKYTTYFNWYDDTITILHGVRPAIYVDLENFQETVNSHFNVPETFVSENKIILNIKDKENDTLIKNTLALINGQKFYMDNGLISIDKNSLSELNTISVENTSCDFYEQTFKLEYLDDSSETIYLEKKKSNTKPYINYVYYKNITSGTKWKNAASEKITVPDTSNEYFDIAIGAAAQIGSVSKICLAQDGAKTLTSTTGIFSSVQLAKVFEPDKDIIAYCIDTNGNVSPAFKTEIEIENADENFTTVLNNSRIELFSTSGSSFKISDDVPFLGGTEIGLDFASLPISVSVDGSKYKVAIGLDDKTFTKDEWNLYKKALDEIRDMGLDNSSSDSEIVNDRQRYKKMQELRKMYGAKAVAGKAVGNGSFDWNILGYVEWEVVKGSPVITSSYIGLSADASYNWQAPYVVLGVPCYTELGVGVSASVGGTASRITADSNLPIEWDIKLSVKPSLSLGAGVGCPSFLSLGVEGKGEFEWYQEFLEKYRKIDLTLSASVKAKAFLLSFNKEFATKTWNLWSGTYGSDSQSITYDYPEESLSSSSVDFLDSAKYKTLADRDYINQTEWIGGYTPMLFSSRAISVSGYDNSLLQTSIYSDSRQQLVEFDGGKMLVWVMDNINRESSNRTELVYSLYDESTATWSEPVAIFDDGTADFLPDVVSDGNNVWVVWQNMNKTFTEETATMENYSASAEICVSKYNSETGEFETAIQITEDSLVDSIPAITAEKGNISVVWVSNSENDFFGTEGVNSIKTASILNDVASDVETVKTDLTSLSSIDCKLTNDELYIAYAYDLDNDYNDMSDMEIYQLKVSNGDVTETRLTENAVLDSAPNYSELGGEASLVWYSEGNFNMLSLASKEVSTVFAESVGATDIYSIAQSAGDITYIIWSQSVGEQVAFYGTVYDGSEWGEPVLLGEASGKALNPSAVVDDNGTMFVVYNNVVQEQVTETVEETGEEFTYYKDIQTDLALLKVYQNSNISLNDDGLEINAETVFPGAIIPLTFNVKNNGTTSVDSIDVYIDGVLNSIVQVELLPGEEISATVNYTIPETITETTLSITAEPSDSSDYDSTDNELSVSYGYTELDVNDVTVYSTALKNTITARICNVSAVDSGAFGIRIHENDANGAIISAENFDNLAVGEALFITQEFDKSSMVYDENGVSKYYIEVVTDSHEYLTGNNNGLAVFTEENNLGITSELLRESVKEGFVHAYGVIQNNEFAEHEVYAKIEVLDEAGNVIGLKFKKVSLTDKQTYTLDENVHTSGEYYETRLTLLDVGTEDISLRIPAGVTTIEELDFEACSDVVKLVVPESVETIGADAFSGCENLTVYCYPNSVAHTYAVDNSIPYVLYQILGIGDTTIDTDNKFIFTDIYESHALADFLTVSGYTAEITPATEDAKLYGTASTIDVYWEGELDSTYKLIVIGDINGDSVCDTLDAAQTELIANGHKGSTIEQIYAANGCVSDEIDVVSYQTVVNTALAS